MALLLLDETVSTDVWLSAKVGGLGETVSSSALWAWLPHCTSSRDEHGSLKEAHLREERTDETMRHRLKLKELNVVIRCLATLLLRSGSGRSSAASFLGSH